MDIVWSRNTIRHIFSQIILFDLLANQLTMRPSVANPDNMIMTSDLDSGKMIKKREQMDTGAR